ncbi:MAG: hypothetical protein U0903_02825 [Planctomycetales bacterium]
MAQINQIQNVARQVAIRNDLRNVLVVGYLHHLECSAAAHLKSGKPMPAPFTGMMQTAMSTGSGCLTRRDSARCSRRTSVARCRWQSSTVPATAQASLFIQRALHS